MEQQAALHAQFFRNEKKRENTSEPQIRAKEPPGQMNEVIHVTWGNPRYTQCTCMEVCCISVSNVLTGSSSNRKY